jgi:hypothetical protein
MPLRTVPGLDLEYFLACVDSTGAERLDDPHGINGRLVPRIAEEIARQPYTDVFLMSHGWMGDVPAAIRQYDRWIAAMAANKQDIVLAKKLRPAFKPLLVGIHWPSLPYGDEGIATQGGTSFSTASMGNPGVGLTTAALIGAYADRIASTPKARHALETIFAAAAIDTAPPALSSEVSDAYRILNNEAGLGDGGPANAPGSDREPFDPDLIYQTVLEQESQLWLYRHVRRSGGMAGEINDRPSSIGVSRTGRDLALVVLRRYPLCKRTARLLPLDP